MTNSDTNTVTFYNGSTSLGTAAPSNGTATFAINSLPAGSDSITACIAAGGNYAAGCSSAITQTVNQGAPIGAINRIAGNGTEGYAGDGGVATVAELNEVTGVAVDSSGNVYIADQNSQRIREAAVSTGIINTIAGNGTAGYSGDSGAATSAKLHTPYGVAVDSSGNIYIADTANNRVREVTASTGVISTIAGTGTAGYSGDGGAATSAKLHGPQSVAIDVSGNVYISDTGNNRIRKVTVSTGVISTVAGTGTGGFSGDGGAATSAKLDGPWGIAVDSSSNVYIADIYNSRIRKVTASTGIISTIAGNGTQGSSGDGGAATSAELYSASGVAVDSSGNVYIADSGDNRVREVTVSTGVINTIAGTGTAGYSGDGGAANSTELDRPYDVAVDSIGNVYIADSDNWAIREVGPSTLASSTNPSSHGSPVTLTATVAGGDTNTVTFYNGATALGTATPSGGTATLSTSSLPTGSDSITACIAAGGNYAAGCFSAIIQTVN